MPGWRFTKIYPRIFTSYRPLTSFIESFTKCFCNEKFVRMATACLGTVMRMADYIPGTVYQIRIVVRALLPASPDPCTISNSYVFVNISFNIQTNRGILRSVHGSIDSTLSNNILNFKPLNTVLDGDRDTSAKQTQTKPTDDMF